VKPPVRQLAFAAAAIAACVAAARANPVSPYAFATDEAYVLTIANVIVGLGEGALLAWISKRPLARCAGAMVLANETSWLLGWRIVMPHGFVRGYDLGPRGILTTFALSILLEAPYVFWAIGPSPQRLRRALRADLIVNGFSYLILMLYVLIEVWKGQ
jgi:hypothetical protein